MKTEKYICYINHRKSRTCEGNKGDSSGKETQANTDKHTNKRASTETLIVRDCCDNERLKSTRRQRGFNYGILFWFWVCQWRQQSRSSTCVCVCVFVRTTHCSVHVRSVAAWTKSNAVTLCVDKVSVSPGKLPVSTCCTSVMLSLVWEYVQA